MKFLRILAVVLLPILMLVLGFELGTSYQTHQLEGERGKIEELFGRSGSGELLQGDPEKQVDLSLFWSVWRLLDRHYVSPDQLKVDRMLYGAVSGLVDSIGDPYTVFMTPADTKTFEDTLSGTLQGIGAQLELVQGQVTVVAPLKGSPAERGGLLPQDVISEVNGVAVTGKSLDDVVKLIRGPQGTTVTLTIVRPPKHEKKTLTLTRENIHVPSVESKIVKTSTGTIAVIALNQFGDTSIKEMREALTALPTADLKGLVLDLRFNGGGYLDGAVDLVSMFQKSGRVVSVDRRDSPPEVHDVNGQPLLPDIPMAVLINKGSASASEITAGALQDNKRATIIGVQSFGKGTVQEILDLPGGSTLRVTIAKWLTPAGHDLGKKGVTPDIVVDRTAEEYQQGKDPQLFAAEEWLLDHRDISKGMKTGSGATK